MLFQTKNSNLKPFYEYLLDVKEKNRIEIHHKFLDDYEKNIQRTNNSDWFVQNCMREDVECKALRKDFNTMDTYGIVACVLLCYKMEVDLGHAINMYRRGIVI